VILIMHDGVFHNPSCSRAFCFPIFCNLLGWQCRAPFVSKLEHGSGSCRKGVLRERKGGKPTRAKEREREREREATGNAEACLRDCSSVEMRKLHCHWKRNSDTRRHYSTYTLKLSFTSTILQNSYYLHFLS